MPLAIDRLSLSALLLMLSVVSTGCEYFGYELRPTTPPPPAEATIFTDKDATSVYGRMVDDALSKPWVDQHITKHAGEAPKIAVGTVGTNNQAAIDVQSVTKQIEEELINSGRVRVLADRSQVRQLVDQRLAQREFTRSEDWADMANQLGIDFLMIGRVGSRLYRDEANQLVTYFQVVLELIDLETAEKVWIQTEEVRKTSTVETPGKPVKWWAWWRAL